MYLPYFQSIQVHLFIFLLYVTFWLGVVLTMLEGCYSGGALVFFVFKQLYFKYGLSLKTMFLAYAVLSAAVIVCQLLFWPWSKFSERKTKKITEVDDEEEYTEEQSLINESNKEPYWRGVESKIGSLLTLQLIRHLFTVDFLFMLIVIPSLILKANFFLATYDDQIELLTDDNEIVDRYETILGLMIPAIGLGLAPMGLFPDHFGVNASVVLLLILSIGDVVCSLFPNVELQLFRFVLFSIWYPFTFATWVTFIAKRFGFTHFGGIFAVIAAVTGFVVMANNVMIDYAVANGKEGFMWCSVWQITVCGVFLILAIMLWVWTLYKNHKKSMGHHSPYVHM